MHIQVSGLIFECVDPTNCIPTGDGFISSRGLGEDSFQRSAGVLIGMTIGFQVIGYLVLRFKKASWMVPKVKE